MVGPAKLEPASELDLDRTGPVAELRESARESACRVPIPWIDRERGAIFGGRLRKPILLEELITPARGSSTSPAGPPELCTIETPPAMKPAASSTRARTKASR